MKTKLALAIGTAALIAMNSSMAMAQRSAEGEAPLPQQITTTDRLVITSPAGGDAKMRTLPTDAAEALRAAGFAGSFKIVDRRYDGAFVVQLERRIEVAEIEEKLRAVKSGQGGISAIEPDYPVTLHAPPITDPNYNQSWGLTNATSGIAAPAGWNNSRGGASIIAVLDTGSLKHPDLFGTINPFAERIALPPVNEEVSAIPSPQRVASPPPLTGGPSVGPIFTGPVTVSSYLLGATNDIYGYDFVNNDPDPSDPGDWTVAGQCGSGWPGYISSWHGTHVTGIAAAMPNTQGSLGASPVAKVLPVRVMGKCGGSFTAIQNGIIWAAGGGNGVIAVNPKPADVINMSLGGQIACPVAMQNAINFAIARGVTIVVSAGNSNTNANLFAPGNCNGVINIAAHNVGGSRAWFSNYGTVVDLAAPGTAIYSTWNTGTTVPAAHSYANYNGTSMAAPFVSSIAAAISSIRPDLDTSQIEGVIKGSTRPFLTSTSCVQCGTGYADMNNALNTAMGLPLPPITNELAAANNAIATAHLMGSFTGVTTLKGSIGPLVGTGADQQDFWAFLVPAYGRLQAVAVPNGSNPLPTVRIVNGSNSILSQMTSQSTSRPAKATFYNATNAPVTAYVRMSSGMHPASVYSVIVKNK